MMLVAWKWNLPRLGTFYILISSKLLTPRLCIQLGSGRLAVCCVGTQVRMLEEAVFWIGEYPTGIYHQRAFCGCGRFGFKSSKTCYVIRRAQMGHFFVLNKWLKSADEEPAIRDGSAGSGMPDEDEARVRSLCPASEAPRDRATMSFVDAAILNRYLFLISPTKSFSRGVTIKKRFFVKLKYPLRHYLFPTLWKINMENPIHYIGNRTFKEKWEYIICLLHIDILNNIVKAHSL